jgi:hypothetical protein
MSVGGGLVSGHGVAIKGQTGVFAGLATAGSIFSMGDVLIGGSYNYTTAALSSPKFKITAASGNLAIATNMFTVAGASGNTFVAGTLAVTGATTLTGAITHTGAVTNSSTAVGPGAGDVVYNKYQRIAVFAINTASTTGIPLLAAVSGRTYRLINATISAYGGAMTSTNATSLEIVSDPAGTPVILFQVLKAQLVRETTAGVGLNIMNPMSASNVLLADNASFVAQVANKGISLMTTGASVDWATAIGVDVWLTYAVD